MAPPVITITRQYASGGSEVARLVAAELAWHVIDNEFVDEVARRAGLPPDAVAQRERSEEHTSELQSRSDLVCRLLLEKKKDTKTTQTGTPICSQVPLPL